MCWAWPSVSGSGPSNIRHIGHLLRTMIMLGQRYQKKNGLGNGLNGAPWLSGPGALGLLPAGFLPTSFLE